MNTIIYTTNTGSTEHYAKLLAQKTGLPVYSLAEAKKRVFAGAEVIYLGWIMAGSVKGYAEAAKRYRVRAACGIGMGQTGTQTDSVRKKSAISADIPLFTLQAEHYKTLFPSHEVIGFDYRSQTPWQAKKEFFAFFTEQRGRCEHLTLVANSIGAYFALSSLDETLVDRAYFISPVVDMENLICNMMQWCLRRCRIGHDARGRNGDENRPCRVFRRGRAFQRVCSNRLQFSTWYSPVL